MAQGGSSQADEKYAVPFPVQGGSGGGGSSQGQWYQPGAPAGTLYGADDSLPQGTFIGGAPGPFPTYHQGQQQSQGYSGYPQYGEVNTVNEVYTGGGPRGGAGGYPGTTTYVQSIQPSRGLGGGQMIVTTMVAPPVDSKTIRYLVLRRHAMTVKICCIIDLIFSILYFLDISTIFMGVLGIVLSVVGIFGAVLYNKCMVYSYAAYTIFNMAVTVIFPLIIIFTYGMSFFLFILYLLMFTLKCCVLSFVLGFAKRIPPRSEGGYKALRQHVLDIRLGNKRPDEDLSGFETRV